jgi:signal peptidase II
MIIAYSLLIAGGVGNLIDRLVFSGRVTDFIHISIGPFRTGIFNVADVAGMVGAGLFFFQLFRRSNHFLHWTLKSLPQCKSRYEARP